MGRSSAALAYYTLFSFFPFLLFLGKLLSFMNISDTILFADFQRFVPEQVLAISRNQLERNAAGTVWLMAGGILFVVYFFTRNVNALFKSFELAMNVSVKRKPYVRFLQSLLFTFLILFCTVLSLLLITVGKTILIRLSGFAFITERFASIWHVLRFVALAAILFSLIYAMYAACCGKCEQRRHIFFGAFFAMVSWVAISIGFSYYVENLGSYTIIYGSIGAVIILLLWFYLGATILLMGAELNGALQEMYNETTK